LTNQASLSYAEHYVAEDEPLLAARARAADTDAVPIGPGGGAVLRLLATLLAARSVVEFGTGCGVSGIWLMRGMAPDGVLTSIDPDAEHQRLARAAFTGAGLTGSRVRLITGRALDVAPRLTDGGYDLVFADADKSEYPDYLAQAVRLLRPGGVVAFDNALWHDRVADPAARDPDTTAVRDLGRTMADHPALVPALLPCGDGLLVAVKRG
jgi:predicted O-methyltransferase YrrM